MVALSPILYGTEGVSLFYTFSDGDWCWESFFRFDFNCRVLIYILYDVYGRIV